MVSYDFAFLILAYFISDYLIFRYVLETDMIAFFSSVHQIAF